MPGLKSVAIAALLCAALASPALATENSRTIIVVDERIDKETNWRIIVMAEEKYDESGAEAVERCTIRNIDQPENLFKANGEFDHKPHNGKNIHMEFAAYSRTGKVYFSVIGDTWKLKSGDRW